MKQITLIEEAIYWVNTVAVQIGCAESPLALLLFVLSFYAASVGGLGFVMVLSTIALQAPLDGSHGELPSDTWTLISTGKYSMKGSVKLGGP